jgi:hypothetical protein
MPVTIRLVSKFATVERARREVPWSVTADEAGAGTNRAIWGDATRPDAVGTARSLCPGGSRGGDTQRWRSRPFAGRTPWAGWVASLVAVAACARTFGCAFIQKFNSADTAVPSLMYRACQAPVESNGLPNSIGC